MELSIAKLLFSSVLWLSWLSSSLCLIEPRETNTCEGRQSAGAICESCELLSMCVRHSSGWVNIPVETCDTDRGFYCNSRLGMCSNMTGPCHPFAVQGNFPCTSYGFFPDPYDCQKYHMCYFAGAALVAATVECGGDKAFDAATGQCSLTLNDPVCLSRQIRCENAGEAHAWPSNPNIFYICKTLWNQDERVLYPTLYRCADGEVFDDYYCRNVTRPIGITTTTTMASIISTSAAPDTGNRTVPTPTNNDRCTAVGLRPDPEDCAGYYYCSALNGIMRHRVCPSGTHFNEQYAACIFG
ncbi:peritrophin-44-like, partial [Rhagoletis pomonella]|uniref:peritrophin-44-like n=1 Tax=Rhagoletis pomonella TaxID=28610 RepID=UPI0017844635